MRVLSIKSLIATAVVAGSAMSAATTPANAGTYGHCAGQTVGAGTSWYSGGVWYFRPPHGVCPGHRATSSYYGGGYFGAGNGYNVAGEPLWHGAYAAGDTLGPYYGGGNYFGEGNGYDAAGRPIWHGARPSPVYLSPYYGGGNY